MRRRRVLGALHLLPAIRRAALVSGAWAKGSTRRWRAIRRAVLHRDKWTCQLCGKPIDPVLKEPHPMSGQVHHTLGKGATGDDPRYLVAAHRDCNLKARTPPRPRRVSRW